MKKLLFTVIIPLTMVCCQSEDENIKQFEPAPIEVIEEPPTVNCFFAFVRGGDLMEVFNYWNNIIGIDGYKNEINHTDHHEFHCFDVSKYTTEEMIEMVKDKY